MKTSELRAQMNRAFDHDEAVELAAEVIKLRVALRTAVMQNDCALILEDEQLHSMLPLLTEHDE